MSRAYHTYTVDDLQYIRDNYAEVSAADIATHLGVSKRTVYTLAHKMGLYKDKAYIIRVAREASSKSTHGGVVTRFKPGVPPFNKGKKMEDYCTPEAIARSARTRFKAGHRPKNWRPVGSERVSKDGYIEVKMREGIRGWEGAKRTQDIIPRWQPTKLRYIESLSYHFRGTDAPKPNTQLPRGD